MSGYDWTEHPSVVDMDGRYFVADPQGRGMWSVVRTTGGWVTVSRVGQNPPLSIRAPEGQLIVFASEQAAVAAILDPDGDR